MTGCTRTARRLAAATTLALALLAAGVVVPLPGGWGQPRAPGSSFGYAPLRGASQPEVGFPRAGLLGGHRPRCPVQGNWPGRAGR
jgi:hypothetical protein